MQKGKGTKLIKETKGEKGNFTFFIRSLGEKGSTESKAICLDKN